MDTHLSDLLKQLALAIKETIDEGISNGTIKPEEKVFATHRLQESIKESNEYSSVLEKLTTTFGRDDTLSSNIEKFVGKIIHRCLYDQKFDNADTDALITTFLKDLREEPVKCGAKVELDGIVLQPERIDIADGVTLRQPKIEDLEEEYPAEIFMMRFQPNPSAILNIEFLGRPPREIERRVRHAIAILRLFKVGSVKYTSYRRYSDSITSPVGGTSYSGAPFAALEKYLITPEDAPKLKNFWLKVSDSIPESFYDADITKADYTTIAYNRYSDALLQNGIFERRVGNAIMGLEALYFKPEGEMHELAYRLRIRVSKLLTLLGYDPHEVKERVNDAYEIRSTFMHGGHLDYKKKRKSESKYKDLKILLLSVLDYLRISIIINLVILKEKKEFIDLIDDSFVDREKEELLTSIISGAKEFIGEIKAQQ